MKTHIDYYLSVTSPWVYLGNPRLEEIALRKNCSVNIKPAKFHEIFSQTGGLPLPKRAPERKAYRLMELRRWSDLLKVPINLQPAHSGADHLPAVRLLLSAADSHQNALPLLTEIGRAVWAREEDIGDANVLAAAAQRAGFDPAALESGAASFEETAARYDRNTSEAVQAGVFGAPSYVLPDGEIFWGQDRLEFLDRALV
ncbi:2-hydroxychromene-2-carboxylate isomerase [Pelagibius sp. Alg239-R121]|uniref:2-hydroxychromene-2-carboxylate isomerase n=1 Tax=Pelagibius sp. Alg239-R121 TaxID=2993448 RepID=UPI0024A64562|nr:2-hydroxychromene-2-carboxylate isomerase [Pelagibius sp. Alg239-R121]